MTMTTALRSQATGRFYKAFHAWSRLGNAHQRRCFVPTNHVNEANDALPSRLTSEQHDRNKNKSPRRDARDTDPASTGPRKSVGYVHIPQERLARILEHPEFLNRLHAVYGTTVKPLEEGHKHHSNLSGTGTVFVETPERKIWRHIKSILRFDNPEKYAFDAPPSSLTDGRNDGGANMMTMNRRVARRVFGLLVENNMELMSKIQERFSVKIDIMTVPEGAQKPGITILGESKACHQALEFIKTFDILDEDPAPIQLNPDEIKDVYKTAMRSVPSSVVVLTTHNGSSHGKVTLDSVHGMTVSSMSSVTLEPEPIVSFSIRGPSRTLDCITQGQPFYVNFLSAYREGARIANQFSKYHEDSSLPFRTIEEQGLAFISPHVESDGPYLKGKHNLAYFKCELLPEKSLEIGDHTVIFARVAHVWASEKLHKQHLTFLAYAQTQYRTLGKRFIELTTSESSEGTDLDGSAPAVTKTSGAQSRQQTTKSQKSKESRVPQGPNAAELEEAKTAQEFNDKYWSMAMGEDEQEDGILEERAADQRAVGDAEKPADFPTRN